MQHVLKQNFRDNSHAESSEDENQTDFRSHIEPKNEPEIKGNFFDFFKIKILQMYFLYVKK